MANLIASTWRRRKKGNIPAGRAPGGSGVPVLPVPVRIAAGTGPRSNIRVGRAHDLLHPRALFFRTDAFAIFLITAVWALAEWLINPAGSFPLNDDWSYTRSLLHLYQDHQFRLEGWTSMPLLGQLLWGLLFCKIFGFSFTVLRWSTLVLSLAGSIGAYCLARQYTPNKTLSLFAALILLLNPLWCNLSNTFMTDVPFASMLIFSLLFFSRALRTNRLVYIFLGMVFVILATMIRQLGILAAIAFSMAYIAKRGIGTRTILFSAAVTIIPVGLYVYYNHWLRSTGNYPSKYDEGLKRVAYYLFSQGHSTVRLLFRQAITILVYCGFFIFPLLFLFDWKLIRQKRQPLAIWTLLLILLTAIYTLLYKPVLPAMGNSINIYGLGPVSLRDISILGSPNLAALPNLFWQLCSIAGVLGGGSIFLSLAISTRRLLLPSHPSGSGTNPFVLNGFTLPLPRSRRVAGTPQKNRTLPPQIFFVLVFAALYMGIVLIGGTYDRYLLPLVPVLTVLLIACFGKQFTVKNYKYLLACILLSGYGFFSIAGTRDYISWNRARWEAISYLTQDKGVRPQQIDGGFEFNGYTQYDERDISALKEHADPTKKSWWWVENDEYLLAFGPVKHYSIIKTFPFHRHLGPSSPTGDKICVLQKVE